MDKATELSLGLTGRDKATQAVRRLLRDLEPGEVYAAMKVLRRTADVALGPPGADPADSVVADTAELEKYLQYQPIIVGNPGRKPE